jgi:hypothetical protein
MVNCSQESFITMKFQKNKFKVGLYRQLMRWASSLAQLPQRLNPAPVRLLQMGSAFWQSRALHVAAKMDIATALGKESLSVEDLALRVQAHPEALYRLMRFLASLGVFEETRPRHFGNNVTSDALRRDHPRSMRSMVLMHGSPQMSKPWWDELEAGVRNGTVPFEQTHGVDLFTYIQTHPDFGALFAQAMDSVQALTGDTFATDFDWTQFERVIDVGGSQGSKSLALLRQHPHLQALVTDRAQVIEGAHEKVLKEQGIEVARRIAFKAADALESIEPASSSKDIYLLCAVLHGLSDAQCLRLLQQLRLAIGESHAHAAVMEVVLAEQHADAMGTSFDMQMLMGTSGRERSLSEWTTLFTQAEFELEEQVGLQSPGAILVLRPVSKPHPTARAH